ncbi:hypothetical protein J6590_087358 [Homalodisca vitripennis]|nr:hypothetical protein J6590_087358 [Homalodisca vitripennis]
MIVFRVCPKELATAPTSNHTVYVYLFIAYPHLRISCFALRIALSHLKTSSIQLLRSHVTGGPIYFLRPTMQHVARNPGARQSSGPTSKYYSDHEGVAGMSSAYQSPLSLIVDPTN